MPNLPLRHLVDGLRLEKGLTIIASYADVLGPDALIQGFDGHAQGIPPSIPIAFQDVLDLRWANHDQIRRILAAHLPMELAIGTQVKLVTTKALGEWPFSFQTLNAVVDIRIRWKQDVESLIQMFDRDGHCEKMERFLGNWKMTNIIPDETIFINH
jgi:hypothetical protein